ncbi:MAG: helix-turn-helix transcriptional regulator [Nocardioidaceae bacterium]
MWFIDERGLGAQLRAERRQTGVTQQELARRAGISRRTLISIEAGQPGDTGKVLAVVRALGLRVRLEPASTAPFGLSDLDDETEEP